MVQIPWASIGHIYEGLWAQNTASTLYSEAWDTLWGIQEDTVHGTNLVVHSALKAGDSVIGPQLVQFPADSLCCTIDYQNHHFL